MRQSRLRGEVARFFSGPVARSVPDIERAVAEARELGAYIALPPMEIPGHGRLAIFFLGEVEHGLWQLP